MPRQRERKTKDPNLLLPQLCKRLDEGKFENLVQMADISGVHAASLQRPVADELVRRISRSFTTAFERPRPQTAEHAFLAWFGLRAMRFTLHSFSTIDSQLLEHSVAPLLSACDRAWDALATSGLASDAVPFADARMLVARLACVVATRLESTQFRIVGAPMAALAPKLLVVSLEPFATMKAGVVATSDQPGVDVATSMRSDALVDRQAALRAVRFCSAHLAAVSAVVSTGLDPLLAAVEAWETAAIAEVLRTLGHVAYAARGAEQLWTTAGCVPLLVRIARGARVMCPPVPMPAGQFELGQSLRTQAMRALVPIARLRSGTGRAARKLLWAEGVPLALARVLTDDSPDPHMSGVPGLESMLADGRAREANAAVDLAHALCADLQLTAEQADSSAAKAALSSALSRRLAAGQGVGGDEQAQAQAQLRQLLEWLGVNAQLSAGAEGDPGKRPRFCSYAPCSKVASVEQQLMGCAKCKVTQYCDRACQKLDWPEHKQTCGKVSRSGGSTISALCLSLFVNHTVRCVAEAMRRGWEARDLVVILEVVGDAQPRERFVRAQALLSGELELASLPVYTELRAQAKGIDVADLCAVTLSKWRQKWLSACQLHEEERVWFSMIGVHALPASELLVDSHIDTPSMNEVGECEQVRRAAQLLRLMPVEGALPAYAVEYLSTAVNYWWLDLSLQHETAARRSRELARMLTRFRGASTMAFTFDAAFGARWLAAVCDAELLPLTKDFLEGA